MRHKIGAKKTGERRPVLSSAVSWKFNCASWREPNLINYRFLKGIRAGANTVVEIQPTLSAVGIGGGTPLGSRKTAESERYYKNPNVFEFISSSYIFDA